MRHSSEEYELIDKIALQVRMDYGFTQDYLDVFKLAGALGVVLTPYSKLTKAQFDQVHAILELEDGFTIMRYEYGHLKYYTFYNDEVSLSR